MSEIDKLLRRTGMVKSSPTGTDNQMMNKLYSSTDYKEYQKRKEEEEKRRAEGRKRDERLKAEIGAVKDIAKADSPTIEKEVPKFDTPLRSMNTNKDFQDNLRNEVTEIRRVNKELGYSDDEIDEMLIPTTEENAIQRRLQQIEEKIKGIDNAPVSGNIDTPLRSMTTNKDFRNRVTADTDNYGDQIKSGWYEKELQNMLSQEAVKEINGRPSRRHEVQAFIDKHPELQMAESDTAFHTGTRFLGELPRQLLDSTESAIKDADTYIVTAGLIGAGMAMTAMTGGAALPVFATTFGSSLAALSPLAAAGAGMSYGSMKHMAEVETGLTYVEYMEDPEMNPEIAKAVATVAGSFNGIVEFLEVGGILSGIPGATVAKNTISKMVKNELAEKIGKIATSYGVNLGSNVLEEVIQESNTSIGLEVARALSREFKNAPNPNTMAGLEAARQYMTSQEYRDRLGETALQTLRSMWLAPIASGVGRTVVNTSLESMARQKAERGFFNNVEAQTQAARELMKETVLGENSTLDMLAGELRNNKDKRAYEWLLMAKPMIEKNLEQDNLTNEDRSRLVDKLNIVNEALAEVEFEAKEKDNTIEIAPTDMSDIKSRIVSGEIQSGISEYNLERYQESVELGIDEIVREMKSEGKTLSEIDEAIQKLLPKKNRTAVMAAVMRKAVEQVDKKANEIKNLNLLSNYDKTEGTLVENEATESPQTDETDVTDTISQTEEQNVSMDATEPQSDIQTQAPVGEAQNTQYETPKEDIGLVDGKYKPSDVVRVPLADINIDNEKYQFRYDGTTDKLDGMEWDDELAGVVTLHENEYGDLYAIDGHHRIIEGQRRGVQDIRAKIYKGISVEEARARGALLNIAQGNASSIDVAKYMRDTNSSLKDMVALGVPPKSKIARDGEALSKLDDGLFKLAATRQIPIERAVMIGREFGDNKPAQRSFLKSLIDIESRGKTLTNNVIQEMIAQEKGMVQESFTEQTLLGEVEDTKSLRVERAEVVAYVKDQLGKKKNLLKNVSQKKNAEVLESVGNKIDTEKSMAEMTLAEQALFLLDKTLNQVGTMTNKMFNEFASQYAKGDKITVKREALNRFIQAMESGEILEEAFGKRTASEQATDALTQDNIPGQADMLGDLSQIKSEPRINVVVDPNTPDTVVENFMPILEAMEKNPIFNGLEIEFAGTEAREVVFTDKELKEHGYDNLQEGVHKVYGWFERPSREGQRDQGSNYKGKITLTNGADKGTLLHETIHFIQDRLNQINPELSAVVSTWENMIREQAAEQGIDVWNGKELLANALTMGEYGYANDNWAESRLVGVDPQIVSEMSVILGKDFLKAAKGDMRASSIKKVTADLKKYANDQLKGTELANNIAQAKKRRINKIKMQLRDKQTVTYYSPDTTTYAIAIPTDTQYEVSIFNETGLLVQAEMTADKLASKLSEMGLYFNPQEVSYQLKTHNRTQIDEAFLGEQVELLRAIQNARVGNFTAKDYDTTLKGKLNQREADDILTAILSAATKGFDKPNSEITFTEYRNRFYSDRDPNELRARERNDKVEIYYRNFTGYEPRTPDATVPEVVVGRYDTAEMAISEQRDIELHQSARYIPEADIRAEYEDFRDNYETYREDFDVMFDGQIKFNISYQLKDGILNDGESALWNFPKHRGELTIEKVERYLREVTGGAAFNREVDRIGSVDTFSERLFWHGSTNYFTKLRPGFKIPEAQRGGGYGETQHTISLSKSKKVASNFSGTSNSVSIYPVVVKEGAKIIDRPDISDAIELEDEILSLWEQKVDAVAIGDWETRFSEQELVVLNPRILATGKPEHHNVYGLRIEEPSQEEIQAMYDGAKEYVAERKSNKSYQIKEDGFTQYLDSINVIDVDGQFVVYDPDINYQLKQSAVDVEGFYSNLERVLDEKLGSRGKAQDILNMLQKNGVKPEEMEWFRIAEFLEGKDMVTKEEILDHMQERRIEFQKEDMGSDFDSWTLHGGEGGSNYTFNAYVYKNNPGRPFTKSGHFGSKENVLAHTRYTDRTDTLGNRILFIEELQSDWHQEGRDRGYANQPVYTPQITMKWNPGGSDYNRMTNRVMKITPHWESYDDNTGELIGRHFNIGEDSVEVALAEAKEKAYYLGDPRTPDAPLKNSITDFMFKIAIKDAVEGGYGRIAWTTGEQQADRYNMRQVVDTLSWSVENHHSEGMGNLQAFKDGEMVVNKEMPESELPNEIGKSLATSLLSQEEQIIESEGIDEIIKPSTSKIRTISGEGLEVGGEFHKKLYNNYIPRMVKKYAKRWGIKPEVVEMGEIRITAEEAMQLLEESDVEEMSKFIEAQSINYVFGYDALQLEEDEMRAYIASALGANNYDDGTSIPVTQQLSIPVTPEMIEDVMTQGQPLFQIKTEGDLLAVHNLTVEELKGSVKLQGLPMASIAVTKTDYEHTRYGDVSILFNSSTIDPRADRNNRVYSGDAYTPSFPRIERKINEDVTETIRMKVINTLEGTEYRRTFNTLLDDENVSDKIDRWGSFEAAYSDDPLFQLTYLTEKGIEFEPVMKKKNYGWDYEIMDKLQEYLADKLEDYHISVQEAKELEPGIRQIINDYYRNVEMKEGFLKTRFQGEGFFAEPLGFGKVDDIYRSVWEYANDESREVIDTYGTKDKLETVVDKADYLNWLSELSDGIIEREGIWNGKDIFTPSGNRRSWESLHYDVTLDNIVKAMKNEDEKAAGMFGGIGRFGAAASRAYSSIDDIKGDMDRLTTMDEETYEAMREEFNERLTALASRIADPRESNQFIAIDRAFEAMVDAIQSSRLPSKVKNTLKEYGGLRITDEAVNDLISLAQEVAQMPTEYFEAKPRRGIGFDEWAGVVLPNDVDNEVVTALQQNGIHFIEFYDRNVEGDRQRAVNELLGKNDVSFQVKKTDTDTENFKKWFKDSKVVDEEGNPLVVYHGTQSGGFSQFNIGDVGAFFTSDRAVASGYAYSNESIENLKIDTYEQMKDYLDQSYMDIYQEDGEYVVEKHQGVGVVGRYDNVDALREDFPRLMKEYGEIQGVYQTYLNIQNPLVVKHTGSDWNDILDPWFEWDDSNPYNGRNVPRTDTNSIAVRARAEGYDGVIFENVMDNASGTNTQYPSTVYVAFSPNQIKSAYNSGAWNADTADIYYQIKNEPAMEERSWSQTVRDANITADWLREMLTDNKMMYTVKGNEDSMIDGARLIDEKGIGYVVQALGSDVEATSKLMAAGMILTHYYQESGDRASAQEMVGLVAKKATTAGQAIQILSYLNKQSPEGMLRFFRGEFDNATTNNQRAMLDKLTKKVGDAVKDINNKAINEADVAGMVEKVQAMTQEELDQQQIAQSDEATGAFLRGEEVQTEQKSNVKAEDIIETIKDHYKGDGEQSLRFKLKQLGLNTTEVKLIADQVEADMLNRTDAEVQAVLDRLAPGKAMAVDKSIKQLMSEGRYGEALKLRLGQKKNVPVFTQEMQDMVYERAQEIAKMPEGRAKDVELAKLIRDIDEQTPVSYTKKLATFRIIMMLLNPVTMLRNIFGNAGFGAIDTFTLNVVGSGVDKILSMKTGQRTTLNRMWDAVKKQVKGYGEGGSIGYQDARMGIDTTGNINKLEMGSRRTFTTGVMGILETALSIGLRVPDQAAKYATFLDTLAEQMEIAGVTEPTQEMIDIAHALGLYRTFNDDTAISNAFLKAREGFNTIGTQGLYKWQGKQGRAQRGGFGFGDVILPFAKTPANIIARSIDYSPVGTIVALTKIYLNQSESDYVKQRMKVEAISRGITGSAIIGAGVLLGSLGILTGSEPDEDRDAYEVQEQAGLREFVINLSALGRMLRMEKDFGELRPGDQLSTYDWFQPSALTVAIGADAAMGEGETFNAISTAIRAFEAGTASLVEQPLLTSVADIFRYGDVGRGITNVAKKLPSSFVPSVVRRIAQAIDGGASDPYAYYSDARQVWNLMMNGIPGSMEIGDIPLGRGALPDRIDIMGEPIRWYGENETVSRFAKAMLSPAIMSQYMPTEEMEFLMEVSRATGDGRVIQTAQETFTLDGVKYEPTPKEFEAMSIYYGKALRNDLDRAADYTRNYTDEEKADEIATIISEIKDEIKYKFINGDFK